MRYLTLALLLAACGGDPPQAPPSYHGGWVMGGDLKVHVIFAGAWQTTDQQRVIGFISSLDGSPWLQILTGYDDWRGARPSGRLSIVGVSQEPCPATPEQLYMMLRAYHPAMDTLYIVVGARGAAISGLSYGGGYHTITAGGVVFAVTSDSGDDALTLAISHELAEAVTDPVPDSAWLGGSSEIADMCQASFERQGAYLVNALWNKSEGRCTTAL